MTMICPKSRFYPQCEECYHSHPHAFIEEYCNVKCWKGNIVCSKINQEGENDIPDNNR